MTGSWPQEDRREVEAMGDVPVAVDDHEVDRIDGEARDEPTSGPDVEPTGDPRVDAALARLAELDDAPTHEHVAIVEDVHRRLHDALADAGSAG